MVTKIATSSWPSWRRTESFSAGMIFPSTNSYFAFLILNSDFLRFLILPFYFSFVL